MPTYKDETTNTYYCSFYYKDYKGETKRKLKRGFALARQAKQWEIDFLQTQAHAPTITFKSLVKQFKEDIATRLKPVTRQNYAAVIDTRIAYFFDNMPINTITPAIVRQWQNDMLAKQYTPATLANTHRILTRVFSYACQYNGLDKNPCSLAGGMGSNKPKNNMQVWTIEQFNSFIAALDDNYTPRAICAPKGELLTAFKTLFFTGVRVGELLALTTADYDNQENTISITKNSVIIEGRETIQDTPKTNKSIRKITLPAKLCTTLDKHICQLQDNSPAAALFPRITRGILRNAIKKYCKLANVPYIRIHDIRHSHASMLINANVQPLAISERLGHESINITLSVYAHLYKSTTQEVADTINNLI